MSKMGGPLEHRRWQQLRPLLHIVSAEESTDNVTSSITPSASAPQQLPSPMQHDSGLCWASQALSECHELLPDVTAAATHSTVGTTTTVDCSISSTQSVSDATVDLLASRLAPLERISPAAKVVLAVGDEMKARLCAHSSQLFFSSVLL